MSQANPFVILVTGAATGIGQLTAHSLAEAGHTVYASMRDITGRNAARTRKELDYAQSHGVDLHVVELDVTSQRLFGKVDPIGLRDQETFFQMSTFQTRSHTNLRSERQFSNAHEPL